MSAIKFCLTTFGSDGLPCRTDANPIIQLLLNTPGLKRGTVYGLNGSPALPQGTLSLQMNTSDKMTNMKRFKRRLLEIVSHQKHITNIATLHPLVVISVYHTVNGDGKLKGGLCKQQFVLSSAIII